MIKYIVALIVLLIFTSGCTTTMPGKPGTSSDLPAWVKNPLTDNQQWLYGIGSGDSLETARTAALADIAGKINTLVSNETQLYQQQIDSKSQELFRSSTVTQTEATELSHVQLQQSVKQGTTTWALMALSKPEYANAQQALLDNFDQQLQLTMQRFSGFTDLQRFTVSESALDLLAQSQQKIVLLRATTQFNSTPYDNRHNTYRRAIYTSRDRLLFAINSDDGGKALAPQLVALLTEHGVKASNKEQGNAQLTISTVIDASVDKNKATKVRLTAVLTTSDTQGKVVGSNQHTAFGRSYSGYEHALQMAANNMALRLKQQGIIKGLGLEKID